VVRNSQSIRYAFENIEDFTSAECNKGIKYIGDYDVCREMFYDISHDSSIHKTPDITYIYIHTHTYAGFEVLTAVDMKSSIFWDITPCNPSKANRSFGGTYRHCLPPLQAGLLLGLFFDPEDGGMFFRNVG
jgi:hypothetical protein